MLRHKEQERGRGFSRDAKTRVIAESLLLCIFFPPRAEKAANPTNSTKSNTYYSKSLYTNL